MGGFFLQRAAMDIATKDNQAEFDRLLAA